MLNSLSGLCVPLPYTDDGWLAPTLSISLTAPGRRPGGGSGGVGGGARGEWDILNML